MPGIPPARRRITKKATPPQRRRLFVLRKTVNKKSRSDRSVQLVGQAGLLSGSVVLVKETLRGSLVDLLDGQLDNCLSILSGVGDSGLSLLDDSLQIALERTVLSGLGLNDPDSLLGRFNVRHSDTSFTLLDSTSYPIIF